MLRKLKYQLKWFALSELFFYLTPALVFKLIFMWNDEHMIQWYIFGHINSIPATFLFREFITRIKVKKWLEL